MDTIFGYCIKVDKKNNIAVAFWPHQRKTVNAFIKLVISNRTDFTPKVYKSFLDFTPRVLFELI